VNIHRLIDSFDGRVSIPEESTPTFARLRFAACYVFFSLLILRRINLLIRGRRRRRRRDKRREEEEEEREGEKKRKKIEISDRKHTRVSSGTMNAGIRQLEVTLMSSVDLFNCQLDLDGVHKELALPEREREKESRSGLNGIINNKTALSIKCWSVK